MDRVKNCGKRKRTIRSTASVAWPYGLDTNTFGLMHAASTSPAALSFKSPLIRCTDGIWNLTSIMRTYRMGLYLPITQGTEGRHHQKYGVVRSEILVGLLGVGRCRNF